MTKKIDKLGDLIPDSVNANAGTPRGQKMISESLARSKAGRSIVVDKNGRIIGGNKTVDAVADLAGPEAKVKVIQTEGDELIVHQRMDLDLTDPDPNNPARQLAYTDNLSSFYSFTLYPEVLLADAQAGFDFDKIGIQDYDWDDLVSSVTKETLLSDIEFKEFDESVEDEVEYHECPNCQHRFPK